MEAKIPSTKYLILGEARRAVEVASGEVKWSLRNQGLSEQEIEERIKRYIEIGEV